MSDEVIGRLRRKIVAASMVAVFVSLAALIFAINYAHYLQVDASLRGAMEEIAGNLGPGREDVPRDGLPPFAGENQPGNEMGAGQGADLGEEQDVNADAALDEGAGLPPDMGFDGGPAAEQGESNWMMHDDRRSARTQYGARFFSVFVNADGSMFVKEKGNSELENEDATDLAQRVLDLRKAEGFLDDYKFAVEEMGDQTRILFLDCTTDLESLNQLVVISLTVGGCAFVIASLFVLRFARLAVKPLEESARKQKQFVSDAGHELKTPLSVIATNMDILEVDLADQPDELEWIDSTNRQVDNMRRLVNDLITLSKMEEQEADLVLTEVSLTDVAYESVATFAQLAHTQGKELVSLIGEDVCVRGDEPGIRQLMSILIDNAIKYAAGDGTIQVEVGLEGRSAVFATRNDWDHNVDPQELSSLFDRFVRGEQSRDRSGGKSGYGLGLSIARAIAQRNNAKLEVAEDADGRIVFRVVFAH